MPDVTEQRKAIAETRARIDARLAELTDHVPDRDELTGVVAKYAGAAGAVVAGVAVLAIVTRSRLSKRRTRHEAQTYAKVLLRGLPDVASSLGGLGLAAAATPEPEVVTVVKGPRSIGTALLMGASVVGGVALGQQLRGQQDG